MTIATSPCIHGTAQSTVVDTRLVEGWRVRSRECPKCGRRWNTVEVPGGEADSLMRLWYKQNNRDVKNKRR